MELDEEKINGIVRRRLEMKRYPIKVGDAEHNIKIVRALKEAGKFLDKKFKDKFISIILLGSRTKGYADKKSDADFQLVVRNADKKERKQMSDYTKWFFKKNLAYAERHLFTVLDVKEKLPEFRDELSKYAEDSHYVGGSTTTLATLFGLAYGRKINKVRLEFLQEIGKLPELKKNKFWSFVKNTHMHDIILPTFLKVYDNKRPSAWPFDTETTEKIFNRRIEKFGLPEWEATKNRLEKAVQSAYRYERKKLDSVR